MAMRSYLCLLAVLPLVVGCAATFGSGGPVSDETTSAGAPELGDEVSQLQRELAEREREVASLNERLRTANAPVASGNAAAIAGGAVLPPNAKPGECYARVEVPARYENRTERVLKSAASERLEVQPARYETVEERVLVREASTRLEVVPGTYGYVEERVLVSPARVSLEAVPAEYGFEEERVLVKAAHTVWKKGTGPIQKVDDATGEIMCLVEVPAEYDTVRRRVMTKAPATRSVMIPARYETVRRRVLESPATTREIHIPGAYEMVKVRREIEPAREQRTQVPAQYQLVTSREIVSKGHMEWRSVLCETNATPTVVAQIQRALQHAGHNPGAIDGVIGRETLAAVASYQRVWGLPRGGLNLETIDALGVSLQK